jgi:hypothetical protein
MPPAVSPPPAPTAYPSNPPMVPPAPVAPAHDFVTNATGFPMPGAPPAPPMAPPPAPVAPAPAPVAAQPSFVGYEPGTNRQIWFNPTTGQNFYA